MLALYKVNTFSWYKNRVYDLDSDYDPTNKLAALEKTMEFGDKRPLGIIYKETKDDYHQRNMVLKHGEALVDKKTDLNVVKGFMKEFI